MGGLFNKKETVIGPNSRVGLDSNCHLCGKFFNKNTTFNELNLHRENCLLESKKRGLQGLMRDLIQSSKDLEELEKAELNRNSKRNNFNSIKTTQNNFKLKNSAESEKNNKKNNSVSAKSDKKKSHILPSSNLLIFDAKELIAQNNLNKKQVIPSKKDSIPLNDKIMSNFSAALMKDFPFEEKLIHFKKHLNNLKVDWRDGYCTLELDRDHFLKQSVAQFNNIDPYKELHINFKGEISHDAGGIIREWFTIIFKELQNTSLKMFELSDTSDFSFKIHKDAESTIENLDTYNFIGKIIAKALLDNLTVNTCFNKMIYKMILDEEILLDDLVFIDKPLYHSLKQLLKLEKVNELGLYFVVQYQLDNKLVEDELIPSGSNILVTNENLDEYIVKRIEHIQQKDKIFINEIKSGLYSLIPDKLIKIFNSDEIELLLNGTPFIDTLDWQINTIYKGYDEFSDVIKNFWSIISNLSQEELARFLQFCTGSSRVPIGGFGALESNRGNLSKFCITRLDWKWDSKNFIRAHTCFNRLDMPDFPNLSSLQQAVDYIIQNEILGFGVD